jgi:hypothetical protein
MELAGSRCQPRAFVTAAETMETAMSSETKLLTHLYECFNRRGIDAALTTMHPAVVWANGLEGGYVHGHDEVRSYWTRQWAAMDSRAEPLAFSVDDTGRVLVDVHLSARGPSGDLLFETRAVHVFDMEDGLIRRFDIR